MKLGLYDKVKKVEPKIRNIILIDELLEFCESVDREYFMECVHTIAAENQP